MRHTVSTFDRIVTREVQRPKGWTPFMRMVSALGLPIVVVPIAVTCALTSLSDGNVEMALVWGFVVVAQVIGFGLKMTLRRERPVTLYVASMRFKSFSFPSGHSYGSLIVYGLLAYLLVWSLPVAAGVVVAIIGVALIILIGISRIYLGAHYPSDVLGGWLFGGVVLALLWMMMRL